MQKIPFINGYAERKYNKSEKPFKLKLQNYSKEFYDNHPDMAPSRNLLLYYGRVTGREAIDERFDNAFKITPWKKAKFWIVNKVIDFLSRLKNHNVTKILRKKG